MSRIPHVAARRVQVARLNAAGHGPAEISRRLMVPYHTAHDDLWALGLPRRALPVVVRAKIGFRAVRRKYGRGPTALRWEGHKAASVADGWPAVVAGAVRHLDLFYRLGPVTLRGHTARAGLTARGSETVLRRLRKAGHIVRVGAGPRKAPVYDLAPAVRERRRQVLAMRSGDVPA